MTTKIINGNSLEELKKLPKKSINMCMTSPPYWALRDYGVEGQLGLEPTFEEYINDLCDIFDEVKKVIRDDGTCWVNLGDTYFGSGKGAGGDGSNKESFTFTEKEERTCNHCGNKFKGWKFQNFCGSACSGVDNTPRTKKGKLPDKTLTMIPMRFAIEMVNRGWILRNTIIWHKPNCMPSSAKDRFTVDFEYLFFFSKKKKYYFETQYEPLQQNSIERMGRKWSGSKHSKTNSYNNMAQQINAGERMDKNRWANDKGRNKRTTWKISTKNFSEAHFAVYPEELCETPIKAGCPEFVCIKCGQPRKKIMESKGTGIDYSNKSNYERQIPDKTVRHSKVKVNAEYIDKGLSDCGCNSGFSGGTVLDPFAGAGTTGLVAEKQNKNSILIELNLEYCDIIKKRLKPYLDQTKLNSHKFAKEKQ